VSEGSVTLSTRPLESMDNHAPGNAGLSHELVVRQQAQVGVSYSPVSRWAAMASWRRADFSFSIENRCCR
jgi:hypothetical protein